MKNREDVLKELFPEDILKLSKDLSDGEIEFLRQMVDMLETKYRPNLAKNWANAEVPEGFFEDIDLFEINEAFASQALASMRELNVSSEITNVNGGAIALGHPLGATGAILTARLLAEMKRRPESRYGLVSMCIGVGMGAAAVFEYLHE